MAELRGRRVLLLFPHLVLPGGALNYMLQLAELLVARGASVGILALKVDRRCYGGIPGVELLEVGGPETSRLGYWLRFPHWQRRINRRIHAWSPDVLVPQVFPANWWAWLYKGTDQRTPLVWVCQEPSAFIHSKSWIAALQPAWKKWLAMLLNPVLASIDVRLSRRCDRIIGNSRFTAGAIEQVYRRPADAIAYPAIDWQVFHPDDSVAREEAVVTVAKLSRFKRVDFLLRVFARLLEARPQLVYHIVGRGEDEAGLQALARELRIADRVLFHRHLDNLQLAALHRSAKLFLHGSVAEPFGMAPLEAIACGTPVVAHASGGPTEFVTPTCGVLVDSLAVDPWAEAAGALLERFEGDAAWRSGVSGAARSFTWEQTLTPLLGVIAAAETGQEVRP